VICTQIISLYILAGAAINVPISNYIHRYTYEAIDGLFRHNVHDSAIKLATEHIRDMQRTFGWTIFPEAWSKLGGPWGDQW
jgi:hypothetical protein